MKTSKIFDRLYLIARKEIYNANKGTRDIRKCITLNHLDKDNTYFRFPTNSKNWFEIQVSRQLSLKTQTLCLAHEYAHFLAYKRGFFKDMPRYIFAVTYSGKYAYPKAKFHVYKEECRAWRISRQILKELGWTDWKLFDPWKKDCLGTYRKCCRA